MRLDDAQALVKQVCDAGRLAHAYLLAGSPRGAAGKLAVFIMQRLACLQTENAPCGLCDHCRQVAEKTWCDNFWVFPIKKSRRISIDQLRETKGSSTPPPFLLPWLGTTAFAGGWKVGVLEGADRMTEPAQNAFLKMLEEPPAQTLLLLIADAPQAMLPTIVSRCQRLDLDEAPPELDEPWRSEVLAILGAERAASPAAAMAAADRLLQVLESMKAHAAGWVQGADAAETGDDDEATEPADESEVEASREVREAREASRYRELRARLLTALAHWYRDLLALRVGAPAPVVHYQAHLDVLRHRAQRLTLAQALANAEGIETLARQLERSLPERALLAYWMDRLAGGAA